MYTYINLYVLIGAQSQHAFSCYQVITKFLFAVLKQADLQKKKNNIKV